MRISVRSENEEPLKKIRYPKTSAILASRTLAVLATVLFVIIIALYGIIALICKGPSPTVRDLFVTTVMETSAAKFLAQMHFTNEEIEKIQQRNAVVQIDEVTNTDSTNKEFEKPTDALPKDTIEIVDVTKALFRGKMMIVHDPSRVKVATAPKFGAEESGARVEDMIKGENAVGGVNAGGFVDVGGVGTGGQPLGIVIKDGKYLSGSLTTKTEVVGFDADNNLVVGKMTGQEAIDRGLRDAVSFGPVFIVNGNAAQITGSGGGLNPRTVIGQRADGAVLLLAIDGRQASSLGASYSDCIEVMLEFGAINACNLDGGSSTIMYYNNEVINVCASLYGPRKMPTAFIVK